ncbi:hypothetical protein, partial [Sporosarcina sp. YIM B06819]|uniref:hypothetical protein n=1 Tax=Sporosarcina sp. YIM B06819 TaxID=3081769 RepID=UPI00298D55AA
FRGHGLDPHEVGHAVVAAGRGVFRLPSTKGLQLALFPLESPPYATINNNRTSNYHNVQNYT